MGQYLGFVFMCIVFIMDLLTVVVILSQLFQTLRLLTTGATGFEISKSYYLNPNIVAMRHVAARGFFCSLPVFVASTGCMVYVAYGPDNIAYSMPVIIFLFIMACILSLVNYKHQAIFLERYTLGKVHEEPLMSHLETIARHPNPTSNFMPDV